MFSILILQIDIIQLNEQQELLPTDKYYSHFIIDLCKGHECRRTGSHGEVGLGTLVVPLVGSLDPELQTTSLILQCLIC